MIVLAGVERNGKMKSKEPYVLVFGVSICDIFGFTQCEFKPYNSNPGAVKVSFGGVCRNIAENMARIGMKTKLISIVGDDANGHSMLAHAQRINLDMDDTLVIEGKSTPTYLAVLDDKGEMVSAVVDLKIADKFSEEFIDSKADVITGAEYMFFDADNPSTVEYIVKKYKGATKFVLDPVSAAKAVPMRDLISYFHTIKPNRHEAEALCGFAIESQEDVRRAGKYFRELGVENVFLSLDADGIYYHNGEEEGIIKALDIPVVNVTGAGDALVAGIGHGYMNNLGMEETVKYAVAMSAITISHAETIHPELDYPFVQAYKDSLKWEVVKF
ncbi:kinase [Priestia taiwanensis]|uniref:Kinase n=2 Tax=Priestia taiwanensis TaxID=1347902 RepID=A0A917ES80_9BACI|nr:kinase [Priestia taiwanensis]